MSATRSWPKWYVSPKHTENTLVIDLCWWKQEASILCLKKKVIIFILKNILLPPASKILYLTQITGGSDHKMSPVSPTRQHWHVSIKMQLFRSPSLASVWSKTTWQLNNFPKTYCLVLVTLTLLYILSEVLILFKSKQSLALWHYQHTLRLDYLK